MSSTNYPDATETTFNTNSYSNPPKKSDNKNWLIGLLLAGLLGSLGYIWYSKKESDDKVTQQQQVIAETVTQKNDLDATYQAALTRLDSITNLNTSLNAEITNKDGAVALLKSEIGSLQQSIKQKTAEGKQTNLEEATLRNKIAQLNSAIDDYKNKVAELEKQNQVLTEENTTVKAERDLVKTEKEQVVSNLEKTTTEKKALENTVDVGSTLTASNFYLSGINEKRSGKEKETSTAKKADKLRIGFDVDGRIATSGVKKVFVCITSPDGTPVQVEALGSGKFNTREEGEKSFTNSIDVDYTQGQRKNVNFDWKPDDKFKTGDYKVEVYQNGFKIGEGKVSFKKGGLFG
jgi:hypothetical protein